MTTQVEVTEISDGKKIAVKSPYHSQWRTVARDELDGHWDRQREAWTFDARNRAEVAQALMEIYGTDGTTAIETATVRIPAHRHEVANRIEFAGRTVAVRHSRDESVQLSLGVLLLEGEFNPSGGSMRYPRINADTTVYLKVADVPKAALAHEDDDSYEIIDVTAPDLDALRAEKERLLQRLAEIDKTLDAH